MEHEQAGDDPDAEFSHVAFAWNTELKNWYFLCAGRMPEEFHRRVEHWVGKGVAPELIRQYACEPVSAAPPEPQALEGGSLEAWIARLRQVSESAAPTPAKPESLSEWSTRVRTEQDQRAQNASSQPVPITGDLWLPIYDRRPQAYFLLQKYGVVTAIITVGTSRTKLEFPECPDVGHGGHDWSQFDYDVMNPNRPILVLDGTPESGFKSFSWLRGLPGTK